MANDNGGGAFWAGLMIGAIIGGVAALFITPKRGEEMRQEIMRRGEEARARAEEMAERAKDTYEEQRSRFQQAVDEAKMASSEKTDEMLNRYRQEAEGRTGT